jgi:hypothetical protein
MTPSLITYSCCCGGGKLYVGPEKSCEATTSRVPMLQLFEKRPTEGRGLWARLAEKSVTAESASSQVQQALIEYAPSRTKPMRITAFGVKVGGAVRRVEGQRRLAAPSRPTRTTQGHTVAPPPRRRQLRTPRRRALQRCDRVARGGTQQRPGTGAALGR